MRDKQTFKKCNFEDMDLYLGQYSACVRGREQK